MKIVTILLMCASISVFAQGTGTGGGGSANNVVSGGGTGTAFDATKSYTFSGTTNTFTGPLSVNPGPLLVGTNVDLDSSAVLYIATIGGRNAIDFLGLNPVMYMGNLSGSYGYMQYVTGLQTLLFQNLSGPLDFQVQSVSKLNLSATTATVGSNANYINLFNGTTFTAPNGANWNSDFIIPSSSAGTTTNAGAFYAASLNIGGNATLGVNAASTLTTPGTTWTAVNGLIMNAGVISYPPTTSGTVTNGAANNLYSGQINGSGSGGITTYGCNTDTNIVFNGNNGAAFGFMKFRQTSTTNILGSNPIVNTWYTNPTQQKAIVSFGVVLPAGASTISQVGIWRAQSGFTNYWKMTSSAGLASESVTNNSASITLDPGASIIVTNLNVTAGAPTLDPSLSTTDYQ